MEEEYTVGAILTKRWLNGIVQYEVHWEGFELSETTWEPLENLMGAKEKVKDFEAAVKAQEAKAREDAKAARLVRSVHSLTSLSLSFH